MTDLTTLTPAQVDALWAPIAYREAEAFAKRLTAQQNMRSAQRILDDVAAGTRAYSSWEISSAQRTVESLPARIEVQEAAELAAREEQVPFSTEWKRRNGWTRAYLVITNGQGHVHRSTSCSTCRPTTQFEWLVDYSGATEQEIVDAAGERACTVCYASAPVALRLDRPTTMFSAEEKARQAAREERAAKKAERDAKMLLHPVTGAVLRSIENRVRTGELGDGYEIGKTERGATNAAVSGLASWLHYGPTHPSAEGWVATADLVAHALVAKNGGEYDVVRADLNERARKSYRREFGQQATRSFGEE